MKTKHLNHIEVFKMDQNLKVPTKNKADTWRDDLILKLDKKKWDIKKSQFER
jgi:hypothetical protein